MLIMYALMLYQTYSDRVEIKRHIIANSCTVEKTNEKSVLELLRLNDPPLIYFQIVVYTVQYGRSQNTEAHTINIQHNGTLRLTISVVVIKEGGGDRWITTS